MKKRLISRRIRTNRWHVVEVHVRWSQLTDTQRDLEIRINSDPSNRSTAAYLTPAKARDVAAVLVAAADQVEGRR